jgi:hypothetical protein
MDAARRRPGFLAVFLLVACSVVAVAPPVAHAAKGGDAVEKVTALNKKALAAYSKQDYDEARSVLREALDLCNSSPGLDKHPIKARTHIHLGIVNIVGFNQRALGIKHFKKALEIQSDIKLTKSLSTADLEEAFAEAQGAGGGGGDEGGGGGSAAQASDEGGGGGGAATARQGGEEGGSASSGDEEEDRPRAKPKQRKRKPSDEDDNDSGEEGTGTGQTGRFFVAVAVGSGFGLATGNGELDPNHKLSAAGFAPAQLGHIAPEVGFFIMPRLLLSVQLRFQYVTGVNGEKTTGSGCGTDNYCEPTKFGLAGFARGVWLFGESGFRPFLGGFLGGGNIRHVLLFSKTNTLCGQNSDTQCVDSLKSGPLFFGPAAGFLWELGSAADLVVALNTELGVPNFTVNFDVNLGLAFRL